jgi:hypothetical protein
MSTDPTIEDLATAPIDLESVPKEHPGRYWLRVANETDRAADAVVPRATRSCPAAGA